MNTIFWFRRDLRLQDNLALFEAAKAGSVQPVFIFSEKIEEDVDRPRIQFLVESLEELKGQTENSLAFYYGDPSEILLELAQESEATTVYSTKSFSTYRAQEDQTVKDNLAKNDIELKLVDSPYAITPGTVFNKSDSHFKVFTPFFKTWQTHTVPSPTKTPKITWKSSKSSEDLPKVSKFESILPGAGEDQAHKELKKFVEEKVSSYKKDRDKPGVLGTSRLSHYLKWGVLHPRQIIDKLPSGVGADTYLSEICWREFYADVLFHRPETATEEFSTKMAHLHYDDTEDASDLFEAWKHGQTGYPIVDAGMRQLVATGWMHNRVRMIVASFLTKDLHIYWLEGAKFFMHHLADGDLASNSHGWQWTAGTGTDASPYFRVFNPTTQSAKFDPEGEYLREWVPEIAHMSNKFIHEPSTNTDGLPADYPEPIVDHAAERKVALERYEMVKAQN